jgi:hypothetical protein
VFFVSYELSVRPLGRPRRRWEDNIKAVLQEVGCMDWSELVQDRGSWRALVSAAMNLRCSITCGEFLESLRNC